MNHERVKMMEVDETRTVEKPQDSEICEQFSFTEKCLVSVDEMFNVVLTNEVYFLPQHSCTTPSVASVNP